jgi:chemotaxis protein histidine kinase CheA
MAETKKTLITIKPAEARRKFGKLISNMAVNLFIEKEYEVTKKRLNDAFDIMDCKDIKNVVHSLKTNARYMCAEDFAIECQAIENCVKENHENIEKLKEIFPSFMQDFDCLYEEVLKYYNEKQGHESDSDDGNEGDDGEGDVDNDQMVNSLTEHKPTGENEIAHRDSEKNDLVLDLPSGKRESYIIDSEYRKIDHLATTEKNSTMIPRKQINSKIYN